MFSKKLQYGLRFLLLLEGSSEYRGVGELSEQGEMPQKFMEAIASSLRKAGLIEVRRGATGGYRLSRLLNAITLQEVVAALEEPELPLNTEAVQLKEKVVNRFLNQVAQQQKLFYQQSNLLQLQEILAEEHSKIMYHI